MPSLINHRIQAAHQGKNPTVICKMPSGWAVLGDQQFMPGYSLLLADPVVSDLNTLTGPQRAQFLNDMAAIGDALLEVTGAYRINYEILGNTEPFLHAHVLPRYLTEPEGPRAVPVWMGYSQVERDSRPFDVDRNRALMQKIAVVIQRQM
jgi:diadenosine tetraphosphate (Ap4A) HIT family hydrolase